jgi:hypothetical protein
MMELFRFIIAHTEMDRNRRFVLSEIRRVPVLDVAFFVRKAYYFVNRRLALGEVKGALKIPG